MKFLLSLLEFYGECAFGYFVIELTKWAWAAAVRLVRVVRVMRIVWKGRA